MVDGDPDDYQQVVSLVVKLSTLPCSIIFIGVGAAKFPKLECFNRKKLWDEDYVMNVREHVQFLRIADSVQPIQIENILKKIPD